MENVIEMRICETRFLALKPDVLYRFTVAPDCERCKQVAKESEVVQVREED